MFWIMRRFGLQNLIVLILIPGALLAAIQHRDTIRARVDLVVVPVSVRDSDGRFVYDLTKEEHARAGSSLATQVA